MRKKILIMSMFCLAAMTIKAEPVHQYEDSIIHQKTLASPSFSRHGKTEQAPLCSSGLMKTFSQEPTLLSGNPTYLKNVAVEREQSKIHFVLPSVSNTGVANVAVEREQSKIHFVLPSVSNMGVANVSEAANWGRNWFIEVKGGASAFLGSFG